MVATARSHLDGLSLDVTSELLSVSTSTVIHCIIANFTGGVMGSECGYACCPGTKIYHDASYVCRLP